MCASRGIGENRAVVETRRRIGIAFPRDPRATDMPESHARTNTEDGAERRGRKESVRERGELVLQAVAFPEGEVRRVRRTLDGRA